tara:strand:- start:329 stop:529 length:201 start_codon:yes stop_codon:yes gene_type:complete
MDNFSPFRFLGVVFTLVIPVICLISIVFVPETSDPIYYFLMSLVGAVSMVAQGFATLLVSLFNIFW